MIALDMLGPLAGELCKQLHEANKPVSSDASIRKSVNSNNKAFVHPNYGVKESVSEALSEIAGIFCEYFKFNEAEW